MIVVIPAVPCTSRVAIAAVPVPETPNVELPRNVPVATVIVPAVILTDAPPAFKVVISTVPAEANVELTENVAVPVVKNLPPVKVKEEVSANVCVTPVAAVKVPAAIVIDAALENETTPLMSNAPVLARLTTLPSLETVNVVAEFARSTFTESSDVVVVPDVIPIAPVISLVVEAVETKVKCPPSAKVV